MKPTVRFPLASHQFDLVAGRKREILPASTFKVFNVERLLHIVYSLCYKKIQRLFSRTGVAVLNLAGDVRPPAHLFSKNVWYINYKQRRQHTKKAWDCRHYPDNRHARLWLYILHVYTIDVSILLLLSRCAKIGVSLPRNNIAKYFTQTSIARSCRYNSCKAIM